MILDKKEDLKENQAFYDVLINGMDKNQNQYLIKIKYDDEIRSFYCADVHTIKFYKEFITLKVNLGNTFLFRVDNIQEMALVELIEPYTPSLIDTRRSIRDNEVF
ncbi:MAG: hypothetical protein IJH63_00635 [Methanobrevibacter sp.]|nr:hypothetical protein [Methanosphaera sp.]MBR0369210.1 hypothetical protein [Methanobrevibacter sp.]